MANSRTTLQMNMDYVRAKLFTFHTVESEVGCDRIRDVCVCLCRC